MVTKKSDNEVFFQSCKIGDLKTIKTELFYNVSPFTRDRVTILRLFIQNLKH